MATNQMAAGPGKAPMPAVVSNNSDWGQKLVALGRRIIKFLQIRNSSKESEGNQEYFGM